MNQALKNLLVIDIETVSSVAEFGDLPERIQSLWTHKASFLKNEEALSVSDLYTSKAGIYAEFGKVICIGMGFFHPGENGNCLRVKSIQHDNEAELLAEFAEIIKKFGDDLMLCAHNGKEFDYPYLGRRFLINDLPLPDVLNLSGKKPWEVNLKDTMELWKFGDYKNYTSLDLLASIFDIPSSKVEMTGADVGRVYYQDHDLEKIARYCRLDVAVTAQLYLRLNQQPIIPEERVSFIE